MRGVGRFIFRRLLRWLAGAGGALALLLCLASAVFWVRSYWVMDVVQWDMEQGTVSFAVSRGQAAVYGYRDEGDNDGFGPTNRPAWRYWAKDPILDLSPEQFGLARRWGWAGFAYGTGAWGTPWPKGLTVPAWALVLANGVLAWAALRRMRRGRRRRARGLCVRCGYDLRASPGRCPECGEAFAPTPPGTPTTSPGRG